MLCISQGTQYVVNICFVYPSLSISHMYVTINTIRCLFLFCIFFKCSMLLRDIFWYCLFIECIQAKCMIVQNLESSYVIYDSYAKNSLNELFIKDVFWKINSCTWPSAWYSLLISVWQYCTKDIFTESAQYCQKRVVGGRRIIWLIIAM